jgi:oligopeptide/dipeptide ABC transporter ATP-binding protein
MTAIPVEDGTLLKVTSLGVSIRSGTRTVRAVHDVSFTLAAGETLGLVGESGCGKTTTARSIVRLLPPTASIVSGSVLFQGSDLLRATPARLRAVRGAAIGFIFQDPTSSLNPVHPVGAQVAEPLQLHAGLSRRAARAEAADLLARVGIPRPMERMDDYPFQMSGGMQQRVMIAIALACRPRLIIADEPTTALDVTIQAQILELITALGAENGTAVLLITHNLGIAAGMCDRIAVMYGGAIVESGSVDSIFYNPAMPYTWGLLDAVPTVGTDRAHPLVPIGGSPPDLSTAIEGCRFAPRCAYSRHVCGSSEPLLEPHDDRTHLTRCFATAAGGWLQ